MSSVPSQHETDAPVIAIGVLAERVGLSASAVRRYETEGLIIPHRTVSGRRLFSHEDIHRVRNIHHLIQDLGLNVEGIRRMQALLPCWDLMPCSPEIRKSCDAYSSSDQPCWMAKNGHCACREQACGEEGCRECVVYRLGSLCTADIKDLFRDQDDFHNPGTAIQELLQRRRRPKEEEG
jgi:MerR family transcriptional regulator/heat shock protein HspR